MRDKLVGAIIPSSTHLEPEWCEGNEGDITQAKWAKGLQNFYRVYGFNYSNEHYAYYHRRFVCFWASCAG